MTTIYAPLFARKPMQPVRVHVITALRSAGKCDKPIIQPSPWFLPISPRNVARKVAYCERQIAILQRWCLCADKDIHSAFVCEIVGWRKRIEQIKAGKL